MPKPDSSSCIPRARPAHNPDNLWEARPKVNPTPGISLDEVDARTYTSGRPGNCQSRKICHTHFKDSIRDPGHERGYRCVQFGDGDVPQEGFLRRLGEVACEGFLTFEHEKRWHPSIADPEQAFPIFRDRMGRLLEMAG